MKLESMGLNIRRLREEKGISQERLAARCGLSKQTIYLLEKGENKNPGIKQLLCISNALSVPLYKVIK